MKRPSFCNVDLDIESKTSLRLLRRELGDRVSVMFSGRMGGRYCLFLELAESRARGQDAVIHGFCSLIEGLSQKSRHLWDTAHRKELDIGYEVRFVRARANRFTIRSSTLRRVAKIGASLAVTIYPET